MCRQCNGMVVGGCFSWMAECAKNQNSIHRGMRCRRINAMQTKHYIVVFRCQSSAYCQCDASAWGLCIFFVEPEPMLTIHYMCVPRRMGGTQQILLSSVGTFMSAGAGCCCGCRCFFWFVFGHLLFMPFCVRKSSLLSSKEGMDEEQNKLLHLFKHQFWSVWIACAWMHDDSLGYSTRHWLLFFQIFHFFYAFLFGVKWICLLLLLVGDVGGGVVLVFHCHADGVDALVRHRHKSFIVWMQFRVVNSPKYIWSASTRAWCCRARIIKTQKQHHCFTLATRQTITARARREDDVFRSQQSHIHIYIHKNWYFCVSGVDVIHSVCHLLHHVCECVSVDFQMKCFRWRTLTRTMRWLFVQAILHFTPVHKLLFYYDASNRNEFGQREKNKICFLSL